MRKREWHVNAHEQLDRRRRLLKIRLGKASLAVKVKVVGSPFISS